MYAGSPVGSRFGKVKRLLVARVRSSTVLSCRRARSQGYCYIQSSGAHTFRSNVGSSVGTSTYLTCQLFNSSGINVVGHGYQTCTTSYPGGQYLWARVYNKSAFSDWLVGVAGT